MGAAARRARLRARADAPSRCSRAKASRGIVDQLSRTPESLAAHVRRVPAHHRPPQDSRSAFDAMLVISPEHLRVFREAGWSQGPVPRRARARCCRSRARSSSAARAASPKGMPEAFAELDAPEVPRRRAAHRPRRRRRRALLGHHRGLGERRRSAANPSPEEDRGTMTASGSCSTRPARASTAATRERAPPARHRSTGATIGLLDITKARGDVFLDRLEELLVERAATRVVRFAKPTFTKPAPDRPAPRDRHQVRRRDRSPRRLRLVHVVQCARHREPRERSGFPSVFVASTEFVDAAEAQATRARRRSRAASSCRTRSRTAPTTRCGPSPTPRSSLEPRRDPPLAPPARPTLTPTPDGGVTQALGSGRALRPRDPSGRGAHEEAFEAAFRDEWMPTLAKDDDARLLYFMRLAHGTGRAYIVTTSPPSATAPRGSARSRMQLGDLRDWARDVDQLRYDVHGKCCSRSRGPTARVGRLRPRSRPTAASTTRPCSWRTPRGRTPACSRTTSRPRDDDYAPSLAKDGPARLLELQGVSADRVGRRPALRGHPVAAGARPRPPRRLLTPEVPAEHRAARHVDARRAARARRLGEPAPAHRALVAAVLSTGTEHGRGCHGPRCRCSTVRRSWPTRRRPSTGALRRRAPRGVPRARVLLPHGSRRRRRPSPTACTRSRARSSRCRTPTGSRSRTCTRRSSAGTRRSATSTRAAAPTGATSSTSAASCPRRALGADDPAWLRLRGPNLWPAALPALRPAVEAWIDAMEALGRTRLPRARPRARPARRPLRRDASRRTRGARQDHPLPGRRRPPRPPGRRRAPRHRARRRSCSRTTCGGLQVQLGDEWVDVPPQSGAFVVNLGEMMQLLTSGYFAATVHRVVSPPPGTDRVSLAYFFNPKLEATLAPLDAAARARGRGARRRERRRRPTRSSPTTATTR